MNQLEELKAMDEVVISAQVASRYLRIDPHSIRLEARYHPEKLGFPVIVTGHRVKIPRVAFIRYLEGEACERDGCDSDH